MPSILFVTSDNSIRAGLQSVFRIKDWRVQDVPTGRMAIQALRGAIPDAVIIDQQLPDFDGLTIIGDARRLAQQQQIVIAALVHNVDRPTAVAYVKAGTNLFLARPIDIVDAYNRVAERVEGAPMLEPLPPADDPLAKPLLVIASPSMNVYDTVLKSLGDEYEYVHFDGGEGIGDARRQCALILVDDGLPGGGLNALASLKAIFGEAPGVALATRGAEVPAEYAATVPKPLRSGAATRHLRAATGRLLLGVNPLPSGIIVRIREGWLELPEEGFAALIEQLRGLTEQVKETKRQWICLTGPYLGSKDGMERSRLVVEATTDPAVKTGVVTAQSKTVRVAHDLRMHPLMVHQSASDFIKAVQDLV